MGKLDEVWKLKGEAGKCGFVGRIRPILNRNVQASPDGFGNLSKRYTFLPDCMVGCAGYSLLKRKTVEASRIENIHPRPENGRGTAGDKPITEAALLVRPLSLAIVFDSARLHLSTHTY